MFQEDSASAKAADQNIDIPNSKRQSLALNNEEELPHVRINPKPNSDFLVDMPVVEETEDVFEFVNKLLALWKLCHHSSNADQNWPRFSGLVTTLFKKVGSKKTVITYLPPIPKRISEYSTIIKIFYQSRQLAKQCNMNYTHIVMDVGAAMKAYQVVWNNLVIWTDILRHPGDFHAMLTETCCVGRNASLLFSI